MGRERERERERESIEYFAAGIPFKREYVRLKTGAPVTAGRILITWTEQI